MTRTRILLLLFAAVAAVASILSLNVHYQMIVSPGYTSFCDVTETVSCEAVYQSAYATLAGVPIAAGGLIWAALVLVLAGWGMRRPASEDARAVGEYVFLLSVIGLAVVLYYGYTSYFVLHKVCLLCTATYVGVFGTFFVSAGVTSMPFASLPGRLVRDLRGLFSAPMALVLALAWAGGSAALVTLFPREVSASAAAAPAAETSAAPAEASAGEPAPAPGQGKVLTAQQRADFERWYAAQPVTPVMVPSDGAKVVIVKFNDYQCPACKQSYLNYKGILARYAAEKPGLVKFMSKDFPLSPQCNSGGVHKAACEAAAAVRMARAAGKGEALEAWLFDNQPALTADLVRQGVRSVAGVMDFDARYQSVLEQVKGDVRLAQSLGVGRTPTFFINGRKIEGGLDPEYFEAAIEYELAHAKP